MLCVLIISLWASCPMKNLSYYGKYGVYLHFTKHKTIIFGISIVNNAFGESFWASVLTPSGVKIRRWQGNGRGSCAASLSACEGALRSKGTLGASAALTSKNPKRRVARQQTGVEPRRTRPDFSSIIHETNKRFMIRVHRVLSDKQHPRLRFEP